MSGMLTTLTAAFILIQANYAPPTGNPLAGPKVEVAPRAQAKSLVVRGFNGEVEVLAVETDVAAIDLLGLTDEQRTIFDRLCIERSALFSKAIRENFDLLTQFGTIDAKAQPAEFAVLLRRTGEALSGYRARGTMMREMSPHLTFAQRRAARALIAEYVQARAEAIRRELGGEANAAEIFIRIKVETLGKMAESAIQSAVAMNVSIFEDLAQRLGLTPEQKQQVQKVFEPIAIQELQGKEVAPLAKFRAFMEISHLVTKEQMAALAEYTREERAAARRAGASTTQSGDGPRRMEGDR